MEDSGIVEVVFRKVRDGNSGNRKEVRCVLKSSGI